MPVEVRWPAIDAVLTMWPLPRSSMAGRNAFTPWITPQRLTPSVHSQSARSIAEIDAPPATPALFITTSAGPQADVQASRSPSTDAHSATSHGTASTSPPAAAMAAAVSSSGGCSMSATTTLIPSAANACATARPIPLAPPVTTATLPVSASMTEYWQVVSAP